MVHENQLLAANRLIWSDRRCRRPIARSTNAANRHVCGCLFAGHASGLVVSSSIRSPGAPQTFSLPQIGRSWLPCRQSKELASWITFVPAANVQGGSDAVVSRNFFRWAFGSLGSCTGAGSDAGRGSMDDCYLFQGRQVRQLHDESVCERPRCNVSPNSRWSAPAS